MLKMKIKSVVVKCFKWIVKGGFKSGNLFIFYCFYGKIKK